VLRSDGGPQGELLQRTPSTSARLEVAPRALESSIEGAEGLRTHQVPPKGVSPLCRKSYSSSVSAGLGRSSKTSEFVAAARQSEREDLSAARAKAPRKRGTQRKDLISSVRTPSLHTLIAQPGSGTGAAPPNGEASQGPSPVDYNLEIEVDFPKDLVLTMQGSAAKNARRTVISRTLGGIATFKTLLECLKLHLPGSIRILSMVEGAKTDDMIAQRILYSGLPNQCRKCRRFGHHARTCTTSRNKVWEGVPSPAGPPPSTSAPVRKQSDGGAPHPKQNQGSRLSRSQKVESSEARNRSNPVHS
jgi:hypothetical protein